MKEAWILVSIVTLGMAQYPDSRNCDCSNSKSPSPGLVAAEYLPPGPPQIQETQSNPGQRIGQQCPPNDPNSNKELVMKAYQLAFGDHDLSNLELYFHQDYIQHNPLVADGLEGLKQGIRGPLGQGPKFKLEFRRVSAEGDLIWLHSKLPLAGKEFAAVDIFRVECGKIKEHWDVLQEIHAGMKSENPHPFF